MDLVNPVVQRVCREAGEQPARFWDKPARERAPSAILWRPCRITSMHPRKENPHAIDVPPP
jgi:hypothetical protein